MLIFHNLQKKCNCRYICAKDAIFEVW